MVSLYIYKYLYMYIYYMSRAGWGICGMLGNPSHPRPHFYPLSRRFLPTCIARDRADGVGSSRAGLYYPPLLRLHFEFQNHKSNPFCFFSKPNFLTRVFIFKTTKPNLRKPASSPFICALWLGHILKAPLLCIDNSSGCGLLSFELCLSVWPPFDGAISAEVSTKFSYMPLSLCIYLSLSFSMHLGFAGCATYSM